VRAGICLVSPDPIGPPEEREAVWADFAAATARHGWSLAVLAAAPEFIPTYEAAGLHVVYQGDEAIVDCSSFSLDGHDRKSVRRAYNRIERSGYTTTFHDPASLAHDDADLHAAILEMCGQSRRGQDERGFSTTLSRLFDPADRGLLMSVTRAADGRVDAFCQWVPARGIGGWSLDIMRRRTDRGDLPNGLTDFTIVATIMELARRGDRGLSLNFAFLRQTLDGERKLVLDALTRPLLDRLASTMGMRSLSSFNDKFGPSWTPRHIVFDRMEAAPLQALLMVGVEGLTDVPLLGRLADLLLGPGALEAGSAGSPSEPQPLRPQEEPRSLQRAAQGRAGEDGEPVDGRDGERVDAALPDSPCEGVGDGVAVVGEGQDGVSAPLHERGQLPVHEDHEGAGLA
jgi:lysyl-tRNA synthetase class 2